MIWWGLLAFQIVNGGLQYKEIGKFKTREDCLFALHEVEPAFDPETQQLVCIKNQIRKKI